MISTRRNENFMRLIDQGFRVYDAYIAWPVDNGASSRTVKFSILSKKHIDKDYIDTHVSEFCIKVVKNIHANDCRYITYNGKDIYSYDSKTNKAYKPERFIYDESNSSATQRRSKSGKKLNRFNGSKNKSSTKSRVAYCLIAIAILYIALSIYNGIQVDKAFKAVNTYSQEVLGRDVLIDKGIIGHSWFYITHPSFNFNEISRNHETRVSYAAYESLGVWNLYDYEVPIVSNAPNATFNDEIESSAVVFYSADEYIHYIGSSDLQIDTILHSGSSDGLSSLIAIIFDTDFLIGGDVKKGDTYKFTTNMQYYNNEEEVRTSGDVENYIIVGDKCRAVITLIEPDCYILAEHIIGVSFK